MKAHNEGKGAKYTRGRGPVELIYYEEFEDKTSAMSREYEIKRLTRNEKEVLRQEWEKNNRSIINGMINSEIKGLESKGER